uniref:Voltage-gated potassium channel subunit beta-2-like n=1 Tax=Phallusia mammillata TaxID=59560 RepID=A0A6F9DEV9_9ASCI|nr:voltage-gated potassium channel subunit beta-2-like [Phallusia mammillata]
MERVKLSNSDLEVSRVCLGCWQFNDGKADNTWHAQDVKVSCAIVDKSLEMGVNFFDTAEAYSDHGSESVLGRALEGRRRDAIVATKFGGRKNTGDKLYRAEDIDQSLTESLQALKTDYVDLYQVHQSVIMKDPAETVKELKRQQALGRIRYYGVSNFGPLSMKDFNEAGGVPVTNQLPYNLLWRSIEYDIIKSCDRYNIDVIAYSPLQQGLLTGKYPNPESVPEGRRRTRHFKGDSTPLSRHGRAGAEVETFQTISDIRDICEKAKIPNMGSAAIAWLLGQPRVSSVIVGASGPEQMVENCKLLQLDRETLGQLSSTSDGLKEKLGDNPDMWAKESRVR